MGNNLYYDLNDGLLCWKDENGNFIPVVTNSALAPDNLQIKDNKLWIFDYEKNDWKVVGDFEFASHADLETKQDKIISVSNINTLIETYKDPGVYNIAISNNQFSSETAILLVSRIFNATSFSKILLTTEGISVVEENQWKLYKWNKLDELEKKQNDFDIEIEQIHNELQNNFEVIQEKKFSTVTCDASGNLTITTSTIDGTSTNTYSINVKGQDGKDGIDGKDGQTPHIGTSGTWMIGNQDTGIQAKGQDGINGKDAPLPQLQIVDGSIQYKLSDASDWSTLITNKEIFVEPDVRNSLPENPTDGQIITWEGNPDQGFDISFTPGKKYQYLAAGRITKETKLLGKAPNSESYTIFNLVSTEKIPSFSLESIKKEILTSNDRVITPAGTYCKMSLIEGQTSLQSLQPIYDDGAKTLPSITGSDAVRTLIDTNPSITHWAVAEVEEVLQSGKWIQIS